MSVEGGSKLGGFTPAPGDDDVSVFPTGCNKRVEGWFHKLCVLVNDAGNVPPPHCHISLYSAASTETLTR